MLDRLRGLVRNPSPTAWVVIVLLVLIAALRNWIATLQDRTDGYLATGVERMPRALYEAIWELERSEAAVEIFGQDVVDHYLNAAKVEQQTYDSIVHPWERERYLERG